MIKCVLFLQAGSNEEKILVYCDIALFIHAFYAVTPCDNLRGYLDRLLRFLGRAGWSLYKS